MSTKAARLGAGNFGGSVSARRQAIAAATKAPTAGARPERIRLDLISVNPDNPREELRDIESLMETFESVGQILAITIATVDAYLAGNPGREGDLEPGAEYVVVDGHRRLEAARRLDWPDIKYTVDDNQVTSDERLLEAAFIANYHGQHMTDLEEAEALRKLVEFYGSQPKAAKRLGMSQGVVNQRLSLLKLSPELQADLTEGRRTKEEVRSLGRLTFEEQKAKADARAAAAKARAAGTKAARKPEAAPAQVGGSEAAGDPIQNPVLDPAVVPSSAAAAGAAGEERVGEPAEPDAATSAAPVVGAVSRPEVPSQAPHTPAHAARPAADSGGLPVWAGREQAWTTEPRWKDVVELGRRIAQDLALPERKRLTAYLARLNGHEEQGTYEPAETEEFAS